MIPNIFDKALEEWIFQGQPISTSCRKFLPTFYRQPSRLISPSRFSSCPAAHAAERKDRPMRILTYEDPALTYKKALGHEASRRWFNILSCAGWNVIPEFAYLTHEFSGHVDLVAFKEGSENYLIEIKYTTLKLAISHFLQAVVYAYSNPQQQCALVLDRGDGNVDLVGVWKTGTEYCAYDLRTQLPVRWHNKEIYKITEAELQEKIDTHMAAYDSDDELDYRLPDITHTKCVRVSQGTANVICPYWCWSEQPQTSYVMKDKDHIVVDGMEYPVIKGEW